LRNEEKVEDGGFHSRKADKKGSSRGKGKIQEKREQKEIGETTSWRVYMKRFKKSSSKKQEWGKRRGEKKEIGFKKERIWYPAAFEEKSRCSKKKKKVIEKMREELNEALRDNSYYYSVKKRGGKPWKKNGVCEIKKDASARSGMNVAARKGRQRASEKRGRFD